MKETQLEVRRRSGIAFEISVSWQSRDRFSSFHFLFFLSHFFRHLAITSIKSNRLAHVQGGGIFSPGLTSRRNRTAPSAQIPAPILDPGESPEIQGRGSPVRIDIDRFHTWRYDLGFGAFLHVECVVPHLLPEHTHSHHRLSSHSYSMYGYRDIALETPILSTIPQSLSCDTFSKSPCRDFRFQGLQLLFLWDSVCFSCIAAIGALPNLEHPEMATKHRNLTSQRS
jgi:hypothetical protein